MLRIALIYSSIYSMTQLPLYGGRGDPPQLKNCLIKVLCVSRGTSKTVPGSWFTSKSRKIWEHNQGCLNYFQTKRWNRMNHTSQISEHKSPDQCSPLYTHCDYDPVYSVSRGLTWTDIIIIQSIKQISISKTMREEASQDDYFQFSAII